MTSNPEAVYQPPETFAKMTIHFMYGASEASSEEAADSYLDRYSFAFLADLAMAGVAMDEVANAVNAGRVSAAHWPEKEPVTDFVWRNDEATTTTLSELADEAVRFCYGQDENAPAGGSFISVGSAMESQQLALAGLIYARVQGRLREVSELSDPQGGGPLYVVRDSFSGQMFETMLPEQR